MSREGLGSIRVSAEDSVHGKIAEKAQSIAMRNVNDFESNFIRMMVSDRFKEFTERSRYPRGFHRLQKIFEASLTEFRWKTEEDRGDASL